MDFLPRNLFVIGVIIAGHGGFGPEIISIAERILGKQEYLEAVSVKVGEGDEILRNKLNDISGALGIDDVMILSDIFGGSISSTCLYFANAKKGHIAVVTGMNLPMVLKVLTYRNTVSLNELVSLACKGGRDGIIDACGLLDNE